MARKQEIVEKPSRDQETFEILHEIEGLSGAEVSRRAAEKGYRINGGTICKLRRKVGYTRYPQRYTMAAAASAVGKSYTLLDDDEIAAIKRKKKQAEIRARALKRARAKRSNGTHASL